MSDKPTSVITRLTVLCVSVAVLLWALQIALTLIAAVWWQILIIACVITTGIVVIITLRNRWP